MTEAAIMFLIYILGALFVIHVVFLTFDLINNVTRDRKYGKRYKLPPIKRR